MALRYKKFHIFFYFFSSLGQAEKKSTETWDFNLQVVILITNKSNLSKQTYEVKGTNWSCWHKGVVHSAKAKLIHIDVIQINLNQLLSWLGFHY